MKFSCFWTDLRQAENQVLCINLQINKKLPNVGHFFSVPVLLSYYFDPFSFSCLTTFYEDQIEEFIQLQMI